jgi:hypothetical protein
METFPSMTLVAGETMTQAKKVKAKKQARIIKMEK